VGNREEK